MTTAQTTPCQVEGCKRPYRAKGYCEWHFKKWRRGEMPKKTHYKLCVEENCRKPRGRWGLCADHFAALKGTPAPAAAAAPAAEAPAEGPSPEAK